MESNEIVPEPESTEDVSVQPLQLTEDLQQNTAMLKAIPAVKETVAIALGNFVFLPKREEDKDKEWVKTPVNVDGHDLVLFSVKTDRPHSVQIYPAVAFNCEGLQYLFSAAPAPAEFYLALKLIREQKLLGPHHEAFFLEHKESQTDVIIDEEQLSITFVNKE